MFYSDNSYVPQHATAGHERDTFISDEYGREIRDLNEVDDGICDWY